MTRTLHVIWVVVILVLAGLSIAAAIAWLLGGRGFIIQTPSMAEYAPVGTFVGSMPAVLSTLRVGQMILFHPPGSTETYFHRIVDVDGGAVRTKGDLNGATDPWTLHADDLVGAEALHVVGLGWLIQAVPFLLVGGLLTWLIVRTYIRPPWKFPATVLGWALVVSIAAFVLKPFVRAVLITKTVTHDRATFSVVATGLFDIQAHAVRGTTRALRPGQPGSVRTSWQDSKGHYLADLAPHLNAWQWAIVIVVVLTPSLLCAWYAWSKRSKPSSPPSA
ncbi:S26 family signal peptidase [Plantibacter sp. VKM Ac-2885]|uniref:S26 family signal peptidase n=1 Tax=Plantibacter sp. VKM Ac-2885 TaxID=2783828 RepID=UPI00188A7328|nr:S26 family signal peptidase [Plantibacter sp. VKM Ac-2885]MBF4514146.1 S26 family signal peptidase [Plantibacter sp. VKM Ac-2885]